MDIKLFGAGDEYLSYYEREASRKWECNRKRADVSEH